jgi:ATP phosphoribosyltransferase
VPARVLDSPLGTVLLRNGLDEASVVTLAPRDLAAALEHGRLSSAITWPSLLSQEVRRGCTVEPFGAFAVHYGLAVRSPGADVTSIADQYPAAFESALAGTPLATAERIPIVGDAETWLARAFVDAAYDTYRTGDTLSAHGLGPFYPSHWESLALVRRAP